MWYPDEMRYLGIDYGTKKVGLAVSDATGKMAFPHSVVKNDNDLISAIMNVIEEKRVKEIVIGHSLDLDGGVNKIHSEVEELITELTLETGLPIHLEPEQYTTQAALREQGRNAQTDASAAALILDSFLKKQIMTNNKSTNKNNQPEGLASEVEAAEVKASAASTPTPIPTSEPAPKKPIISYDDFAKLDITIGTITSVEVVENADKLLKLTVEVGEDEPRQIVSGIREYFSDPQELVGKQCPFLTNLESRTIRGLESQGMILAVSDSDTFALLTPHITIAAGAKVK